MAENTETSELLKKVRKIEIKTRGLSRQVFAGEYHSAFKGRGMAFSEVREYQFGDDIRSIDWNVTARFNHPYIKIFEEERELTVMLLVDISGSREFGSKQQLKRNLITELSAVLSFSAIQNNDKIGAVLFSDKIEKYIPPKKGRQHILRIIRELIEFEPENTSTDISGALRFLTNAIKKRSTAFLISDFMDFDENKNQQPLSVRFNDALRIAARKHDLIALRIFDKRETSLPPVGLIKLRDAETGKFLWVNTSSKNVRETYTVWWNNFSLILKDSFSRAGVDNVSLATDEDYVTPLLNLFKKR
jgi:uncharacterized protein (DUF58 family)